MRLATFGRLAEDFAEYFEKSRTAHDEEVEREQADDDCCPASLARERPSAWCERQRDAGDGQKRADRGRDQGQRRWIEFERGRRHEGGRTRGRSRSSQRQELDEFFVVVAPGAQIAFETRADPHGYERQEHQSAAAVCGFRLVRRFALWKDVRHEANHTAGRARTVHGLSRSRGVYFARRS